ncbi:hypothetical protein HPB49_011611 [Dermacentor silvarum]|uniref:Uncharacterized protein n=1 Tax=Dermacentor silvarum TaxID=543639 RepID=A0ACB8DP98_DERSI|nr:hypothetical protein HPB49_011611 [Dermacentor silvarum]
MPRQRREKTDDQIAAEKRRRADARRLKRAQETSEQRAERLAQDRESRRTRRQQDTDQVRDARIVSDREAKRAYRAAEETPEARAERVIKGRQAQRKRRETETPEDGAQRRGKDREAKRARLRLIRSGKSSGSQGGQFFGPWTILHGNTTKGLLPPQVSLYKSTYRRVASGGSRDAGFDSATAATPTQMASQTPARCAKSGSVRRAPTSHDSNTEERMDFADIGPHQAMTTKTGISPAPSTINNGDNTTDKRIQDAQEGWTTLASTRERKMQRRERAQEHQKNNSPKNTHKRNFCPRRNGKKLPPLPKDNFKVIVRPHQGLPLRAITTPVMARAIIEACDEKIQELMCAHNRDCVCEGFVERKILQTDTNVTGSVAHVVKPT